MADERVAISGNTFPVREQLRALGGIWAPDRKAWMVPAAKAEAARALLPPAPARCGGVRVRRGLPHGELWQPCLRRGCDTEPVCVSCERCERHCTCPVEPEDALHDQKQEDIAWMAREAEAEMRDEEGFGWDRSKLG